MLGMVAYSRRPQSGQITCYLNRTYHVLLTLEDVRLDKDGSGGQSCAGAFAQFFGRKGDLWHLPCGPVI
jgi:hypothetical protein